MENSSTIIANWLKEVRVSQKITTSALAQLAGTTHGTISRVENGRTGVTTLFLRRVLDALNISFSKLIELNVIPETTPNPDTYFETIADLRFSTSGIDDLSKFSELPSQLRTEVSTKLYKYYLEKQHNNANSFDSLLEETDDPLQVLPIPSDYIFEIRLELLRSAAARKGVLIPRDMGAFLYRSRKSHSASLRYMSNYAELSHAGLRRLENNFGERALFKNVVELDRLLELRGEFIALNWVMISQYIDIINLCSENETRQRWLQWVECFVSIQRLLQHECPNDYIWFGLFQQWLIEAGDNNN